MKGSRATRQREKTPPTTQSGQIFKAVLLLFWLSVGVYFGIGGWTKFVFDTWQDQATEAHKKVNCYDPNHQGIPYGKDREVFCTFEDIYVAQQQEQIENTFFSWVFVLPTPLPLILASFAFGAVGSIVILLRFMLAHRHFPDYYALTISPLLGGLTALMLSGLSYLVPSVFAIGGVILRPTTQLFLSLFAGAFSEHIFRWFELTMGKLFNVRKEQS